VREFRKKRRDTSNNAILQIMFQPECFRVSTKPVLTVPCEIHRAALSMEDSQEKGHFLKLETLHGK